MLKSHQTASAVLQRSRLSFAASTCPPPPKMSTTEAPLRPQHAHADDPRPQQQRPQQPPSVYFPLGYKDAAYQWWTSVTPPMAERTVLSLIPHLREDVGNTSSAPSDAPDPFGTRVWRRSLVKLSGKNRALNEVCVERVGEDVDETLVMVHGYGAGLGFFYKNVEPISRIPGLRLYALDMLGMGNSSRPSFKIHAKDKEQQVIEAENWFIDALEEWRKARRIERFTLLGHSLGGYLAVSYALKYPGRLKKLILASPVGIPEDPYAVNASMPEPQESTMENEFTQDQQSTTETSAAQRPKEVAAPNAPKRPLPSWLVWLWDANISPFSIVRMTGPLGPRFVSGWSSRRFNHLPPDEAQALHDYSFSIFKQKGSGEYVLAYVLAPGAYARRPIINRIHQETGIPIVFMYGENDWMDVAGGLAAEEKLKAAKANVLRYGTDEEKRNENGSAKVVIVPKAGHHLYLDNPDHFNKVLREEIEATMQVEKQKRAAT
ncbi:alpha/beta hydrolase fold domain-containing protein [Hirsutella rhossiliensis]|uniref:Alpha/beta hydrolase fold domain-containing protein n=1 Tax=Hirsutella rhossiliensis TaxID=111463 RepID=A0A9P8SL13_9HYPO|nr:alpha/beta hydrolase fold domain-containing protein [Hirsutella rhossiliensis]KAH0965794.1 alpha/beta hydrolase fold domain-containing protein [Hirsutella rhossiliensis]